MTSWRVSAAWSAALRGYGSRMDWWTLVFAAIAAVASTVVARWGWVDRPQHGWNIRRTHDPGVDEQTEAGATYKRPKMTFTVRAVGTAVVHNVEVRAPGSLRCAPKSDSTMFQASMGVGSEPIVFDVWFSEKAESKVYIEIIWTRLRPYRAYGERVEVESLAWEEWRWHWGRVCLRRRPGGKWWTARPVRTSGGWVPMGGRARAEIPR